MYNLLKTKELKGAVGSPERTLANIKKIGIKHNKVDVIFFYELNSLQRFIARNRSIGKNLLLCFSQPDKAVLIWEK